MEEEKIILKENDRKSIMKLREFVDQKWSASYHRYIFNVFYLLGQWRNISVVKNITLVCFEKDLLCALKVRKMLVNIIWSPTQWAP